MLHSDDTCTTDETLDLDKAPDYPPSPPDSLNSASHSAKAIDPHLDAIGKLQLALLQESGLRTEHRLVEIFCGTSCLAPQMRNPICGEYQGMDLFPAPHGELQARLDAKPFPGLPLSIEDGIADFVCAYAVTRMLNQQDAFRLLEEAKRIVKPGGKIALSFLEFLIPEHWDLFAASDTPPLLLTREAIGAWASHLGLGLDGLHAANTLSINLRTPIVLGDGSVMERYGALTESVCVLKKPERVKPHVPVEQLQVKLHGAPPNLHLRIRRHANLTEWPEHLYLFAKDAYDDQLYTLIGKQFIPVSLKNLRPLPTPADDTDELLAMDGAVDFPYGAKLEIYIASGGEPEQSYLSGNYRLIYCTQEAHGRPSSKVTGHPLIIRVTPENFDERAYVIANPDVAREVREGKIESGTRHYQRYGQYEQRYQRNLSPSFFAAKSAKMQRILPLLQPDRTYEILNDCLDLLPAELRLQFGSAATDAISENTYDKYALQMIEELSDGLILDCGSGRRPVYYENVVNFEVVDYDTTDVRGTAESLPFVDGAFDAVISLAVLEHVKNPFACAKEIARVLKPGGKLLCAVPFLQPFHAYPHHYYNMTSQGLANLFAEDIHIDKIDVYGGLLPISSLTWIVRSWANGLDGKTRHDFLNMQLDAFLRPMEDFLIMPFVTELSAEKNKELASATALFGRKKA